MNSVGLQFEYFIIVDLLQEIKSVQYCGCQFHSGDILVLFSVTLFNSLSDLVMKPGS